MDNKQIANRLKELAKKNNTTISKMAQEIGQGKNIINSLEKQNSSPSLETISKIAEYFNVSIDYIAGREEKPIEKENKGFISSTAKDGGYQTVINNSETLKPLEMELINSFRKLPRKKQLELLSMMEEE